MFKEEGRRRFQEVRHKVRRKKEVEEKDGNEGERWREGGLEEKRKQRKE